MALQTNNTVQNPFAQGLSKIAAPRMSAGVAQGFQPANFSQGFQGWRPPADTNKPALKSTTIKYNDAGGVDTHKTEYHPPVQQQAQPQQNVSSGSLPLVNPNAMFNAKAGNEQPGQSLTTPSTSYPGLVSGIVSSGIAGGGLGSAAMEQAKSAQAQYQRALDALTQSRLNEASALGKVGTSPIPLEFQQGRAAVLQGQYQAQQEALAQQASGAASLYGPALSTAAAGTGQQIGAFGTAAGLTPEALRFGGTGQPGQGGLDPQTQASQAAESVISGKMSYGDALNSMGIYGNAGQLFLQNAIRSKQPDFNFAQAQSLGQTQGTVTPQLQAAKNAITLLQNTFNNAPQWQKTGIPALNSLTNLFSGLTGVGLKTETSKQNAIKEARTQVANALGVMTNTTPTNWTAMVESWFPDNATPDQVQAGIEQFAAQAMYRQQVYGSPGTVQPFSQTNSANANSDLYSF